MDLAKEIKMEDIKSNLRVALTNDSYSLHKILPSKASERFLSVFAECVGDRWIP